jgi:hypothetical protein
MRAVLPVIALGFLAACTSQRSPQYSAPAPAYRPPVSYQTQSSQTQSSTVTSADAANTPTVNADSTASAAAYCQRFGMVAQLQSVQPPDAGNTAFYNCISAAPIAYGATPYGTAPTQVYQTQTSPAPVYQAPGPVYNNGPTYNAAPVVQCADLLHQDRPGGSDYRGPPVPGC